MLKFCKSLLVFNPQGNKLWDLQGFFNISLLKTCVVSLIHIPTLYFSVVITWKSGIFQPKVQEIGLSLSFSFFKITRSIICWSPEWNTLDPYNPTGSILVKQQQPKTSWNVEKLHASIQLVGFPSYLSARVGGLHRDGLWPCPVSIPVSSSSFLLRSYSVLEFTTFVKELETMNILKGRREA